jgi:hypothetical protein
MGARIKAEFVVTAPNVLHQRVAAHDHPRRMIAFEAAHRAEPGFEPAVVALDAVVRTRGANKLLDKSSSICYTPRQVFPGRDFIP